MSPAGTHDYPQIRSWYERPDQPYYQMPFARDAGLHLSEGPVKVHARRILAKPGLRDRVQAVVPAYESGLITPGN